MLNERSGIVGTRLPGAGGRAGLDGRDARRAVAEQYFVDERLIVDRSSHGLSEHHILKRCSTVTVRFESAGRIGLVGRAGVDPDLSEARDHGATGLEAAGLQRVQDVRGCEVAEVHLTGLKGSRLRILVAVDAVDDLVDVRREARIEPPVVRIAVHLHVLVLHVLRDDERAGAHGRVPGLLLRSLVVVLELAPRVFGQEEFVQEHGGAGVERGRLLAGQHHRGVVGRGRGVHQREVGAVVGDVVRLVEVQRPRGIRGAERLAVGPFHAASEVVGERHPVGARIHARHDRVLEVGAEVRGREVDRDVVRERPHHVVGSEVADQRIERARFGDVGVREDDLLSRSRCGRRILCERGVHQEHGDDHGRREHRERQSVRALHPVASKHGLPFPGSCLVLRARGLDRSFSLASAHGPDASARVAERLARGGLYSMRRPRGDS